MDFVHTWVGYVAIYATDTNAVLVSDCWYGAQPDCQTSIDIVQEFMDDLSSASTMSRRQPAIRTMDIVHMSQSYFPHGIAHILLSMRYASEYIHNANANTDQQVLYGMIQQIAQEYPVGPVRDQYTTAAANFRIPYWDWAAIPAPGKSVFPDSVGGSPSILVNGPAGAQVIANPLFSYQFKPLDRTALSDPPVGSPTISNQLPLLSG